MESLRSFVVKEAPSLSRPSPKNVNRDIVLELLVTVLPPPSLQYVIHMRLNGVELRSRLVGLNNGILPPGSGHRELSIGTR